MSRLDKIDIGLVGIGHAISENQLSVPMYQRSYAWEEKHVTDLLEDLNKAIEDSEQEYFLGSIVVTEGASGRIEVIDGQQRLATITILICAIRDSFYSNGNKEDADEIDREFVFSKVRRTHERIPKLILNENDNDFFQKRILTFPDDKDRHVKTGSKKSHERILKAFDTIEKYVKGIISNTRTPSDKLHDWIEYIEKYVKVIWVAVPDYSNAFIMFETLNNRGLDLAKSDLLKNHLLGLSQDRRYEVQQKWASMYGALEAIDSENMVVTYIRQLWESKYGLTREKELFEKIKKVVVSKRTAIDLSNELLENSRIYAAILNPGHEFWGDYGTSDRQYMQTLNSLKMIQIRPLLISILGKFSGKEISKSLQLMVSWSVRFLVYGGIGKLEQEYCDRAVEVYKGKITTTNQLVEAMRDVVPTDSQFKAAFEIWSVSKANLARYILRALEKVAKGQHHPELVPNPDEEQLNLEHIMPQSLSDAWSPISPEEARANCDRLGNMVLLASRINSSVGNDGFLAKLPFYKDNELLLTSSVGKYNDWGVKEINDRQRKLAELAVKAWPYKV